MTQNVCVSVQMDEKGFRDFASFDLLRHNKGWQRPAVFTAILLVCAGICLSQIGKREGAGLLTAVLTIVAIGLPAVYFGTFFSNLSKQIKKLGLPRPFYRLELDAAGLSVWMAGEQNKTEPTNRYTWNTVYCAYRTKEAVYIYVQKNQAYLLNESMDAAWSLLGSTLPAARRHDCRKEGSGKSIFLSGSRSICGRSGILFLHNIFYKTKTHAAAKQKRSVGTEIAL